MLSHALDPNTTNLNEITTMIMIKTPTVLKLLHSDPIPNFSHIFLSIYTPSIKTPNMCMGCLLLLLSLPLPTPFPLTLLIFSLALPLNPSPSITFYALGHIALTDSLTFAIYIFLSTSPSIINTFALCITLIVVVH